MRLIEIIHKHFLIWSLEQTKGDKEAAAKLLGISIRTFRNWELHFGIRDRSRFRLSLVPEEKLCDSDRTE